MPADVDPDGSNGRRGSWRRGQPPSPGWVLALCAFLVVVGVGTVDLGAKTLAVTPASSAFLTLFGGLLIS